MDRESVRRARSTHFHQFVHPPRSLDGGDVAAILEWRSGDKSSQHTLTADPIEEGDTLWLGAERETIFGCTFECFMDELLADSTSLKSWSDQDFWNCRKKNSRRRGYESFRLTRVLPKLRY